ncbi:hypothetical protein THRCLA_22338 [Thraustotheca clavata]|uniref:Uncharacterized protein n=1 Tax=Thraustotheca clavata TaxID=74557 RepID=A0A1V9Z569_9STRA|nr:hypothetical protein THRCLA_22338 [Thraustotheca clavata]
MEKTNGEKNNEQQLWSMIDKLTEQLQGVIHLSNAQKLKHKQLRNQIYDIVATCFLNELHSGRNVMAE